VYVRNNSLRYVDRNGKELFVIVNGKDYKVVQDGKNYILQGNTGSDQLVRDSAAIINRFGTRFGSALGTLISGKQISTISIDGETTRPNALTVANVAEGVTTSTSSDVGISGNDDTSLLSVGTELLIASELTKNANPYTQTSQNPNDGSLAMASQDGVMNTITARTRLQQDKEDEVRRRFNITTVDRGRTRYDIGTGPDHEDFGQGSGRQPGEGPGPGLQPVSPPRSLPTPPPPPPRPKPKVAP
jgi:hypothetical protein